MCSVKVTDMKCNSMRVIQVVASVARVVLIQLFFHGHNVVLGNIIVVHMVVARKSTTIIQTLEF